MSKHGIVGRVLQLARADATGVIDSAEDPQILLEQLVGDYTVNIFEAEQTIARTIAGLRMIEDDKSQDARAAQQWGTKARAASSTADQLRAAGKADGACTFDDLARVALQRQLTAEDDVVCGQHLIDAQTESVQTLKTGLGQMKIRLSGLLHNRDSLVAPPRGAQAVGHLRRAAKSVDLMDPADELGRFEEKVRREEARVRGHEEPAAASLDAQFASSGDGDNQPEIESRLQELKAGRAMASAKAKAAEQGQALH
jgi:phage shock protein A